MSNLIVEPSPHIKSGNTTQKIMLHVIIALMPALIASVYIFGINSLILTVISVTSCVVFEYIFRVIVKKEQTVSDLSAVVTGILIAFNVPATLPYYMPIIGAFVAIVIVKQMFGGIGQNFANPAIVARIVLALSFTSRMSDFVKPFYYKLGELDAVSTVTPLALGEGSAELPSYMDMFMGLHGGTIGETCSAALLIGLLYLLILRIINPVTPFIFVGTVAVTTLLTGGDVTYQVLSGGLLLGAIFMATDYATTPLTTKGKIIFGIGCGLITVVIRSFSSMAEGVSFAILLMNILTPYIDKLTAPRAFGYKKEAKKNE